MAAKVTVKDFIDETQKILNFANDNIFNQIGDKERVWFVLNEAKEALKDAVTFSTKPGIALSHVSDVAIDVARFVMEVLKSQKPPVDTRKIEHDLIAIEIAYEDNDFPDEKNGDIFAQSLKVIQASKRIVHFVSKQNKNQCCSCSLL